MFTTDFALLRSLVTLNFHFKSMLFSLVLFLCSSLVLAFRGSLPSFGKLRGYELRAIHKPRALESQSNCASESDWPGCTPIKHRSTEKSTKHGPRKSIIERKDKVSRSEEKISTDERPSPRKYSDAEKKATMTAMKKMQYFERQKDNPELETGHSDDELGFVSPTFRSGFVSIVGNANVGKSTLMNHLLGQDLSIVSPKPQTTRHKIFGILTKMPENTSIADESDRERILEEGPYSLSEQISKVIPLHQYQREGYQMIFADTPGMLAPAYKLQEVMQNTVRVAAKDGDVVLLVTDVYGEPLMDEKVMKRLAATDRPVIVAVNKVDLAPKHDLEPLQGSSVAEHGDNANVSEANDVVTYATTKPSKKVKPAVQSFATIQALWQQRLPNAVILDISALRGTGVPLLLHQLVQHLPCGPLYYPKDSVADRDERFFATEMIRECVLKLYQEEIPYSCEVVMNSFEDKSDSFSVLHAAVIVARQSQKAIIIGTRGSKLAQLGTMARQKIEKFLGRKIYLDLQVKVDEEWRGKEQSLTKYGYIKK